MITTMYEVEQLLKKQGIRYFDIEPLITRYGIVYITFYRVHWFSFILKKRIKYVKNIIKEETQPGIYWDYIVMSKKSSN